MELRQAMRPPASAVTAAAYAAAVIAAALLFFSASAHAVPSFARQTGIACEGCHTVFPELTPFGRRFKLNGYLIDNLPQVKALTPQSTEALALNWLPPLSVQFIGSYTRTKTALPDPGGGSSQNGSTQFPEQFSLFYAGKIAPKLGGFVQVTYDNQSDSVGWDNTDIRFADLASLGGRPVVWGITANNSPTVQDPWNSTSAWKYPFSQQSSLMPSPVAVTQLDGLGNDKVAGLGLYGFFNNLVYAEFSAYGPAPHRLNGQPLNSQFANASVHGVAPYWRVAVEPQWGQSTFSIGALGFRDQLTPGNSNVTTGPYDKFTDYAVDVQYQFIAEDHIVSLQGIYIHEKQDLAASLAADPSQKLQQFRVGGSYFYQRTVGGSLGVFHMSGTSNATYAASSANSSPNSAGWQAEIDYLPWQNVKLGLQYTAFTKFNGAGSNYDGTGRNASSNDTIYLFGWLAY
jgi:hypothetical protein